MSSALGDVYISPELILMNIEAKTDQEAIEILAKHLYEMAAAVLIAEL